MVNKKGITIIHKHSVVQHHLGLLPHPWGRLHASATKLFKSQRVQEFQLQTLTLKKPGYCMLIHICYLGQSGMHNIIIIRATNHLNVCTGPLRKCGCCIIALFRCGLRTQRL